MEDFGGSQRKEELSDGEESSVHQEGTSVSREGSRVHQEGTSVSRERSRVHQEGSSRSQEGGAVSKEGSRVLQEGSSRSQEGGAVSKEGSRVLQEETCPRSFGFELPWLVWEEITKTGKPMPGKPGWHRASACWKDVILKELQAVNPRCKFSLRGISLRFRAPGVTIWGSGSYAAVRLTCSRPTKEKRETKTAKETQKEEETKEDEENKKEEEEEEPKEAEDADEDLCQVSYEIRVNDVPVKDTPVPFQVDQRSGPDPHESHPSTGKLSETRFRTYLTGAAKAEVLAKLDAHSGTIKSFAQDLSAAAAEGGAIQTGNLSSCPTVGALRKARSVAKKERQLSENFAVSVDKWNGELVEEDEAKGLPKHAVMGYAQVIHLRPFGVLAYDEMALLLLRRMQLEGGIRVFADATGGICRQTPGEKKPTFLYAMRAECPSAPSLNLDYPLVVALSNAHDTIRIQSFLSHPFETLQKRLPGDFPISPQEFVSDHSLPFLRAATQSWNNMRLWQYVRETFRIMKQGESSEGIRNLTWLYVCGFHVLVSFPLGAAKSRAQSKRNTTLRKALGALVLCETLERLKGALGLLATLVTARYNTTRVNEALEDLLRLASAQPELVAKATELGELEGQAIEAGENPGDEEGFISRLASFSQPLEVPSLEAAEQGTSQRERSPFYQELLPSLLKGKQEAGEADAAELGDGAEVPALNPFRHDCLFRHLENNFLPHAPLLTGIARHPARFATDSGKEPALAGPIAPFTNNKLERFFGVLKGREAQISSHPSYLLEAKHKLTPQELLCNMKQQYDREVREKEEAAETGQDKALYKVVCLKRRRQKGEKAEPEVEERWGKSPAKRPRSAGPKFLRPPTPLRQPTPVPSPKPSPILYTAMDVESKGRLSGDLEKLGRVELAQALAGMREGVEAGDGRGFTFHLDKARCAIGQLMGSPIRRVGAKTVQSLTAIDREGLLRMTDGAMGLTMAMFCPSCGDEPLQSVKSISVYCGQRLTIPQYLEEELDPSGPLTTLCNQCGVSLARVDTYLSEPDLCLPLVVDVGGKADLDSCVQPLKELPQRLKINGRSFRLRGISYQTRPKDSLGHYIAFLPSRLKKDGKVGLRDWFVFDGRAGPYGLIQPVYPPTFFRNLLRETPTIPSTAIYAQEA